MCASELNPVRSYGTSRATLGIGILALAASIPPVSIEDYVGMLCACFIAIVYRRTAIRGRQIDIKGLGGIILATVDVANLSRVSIGYGKLTYGPISSVNLETKNGKKWKMRFVGIEEAKSFVREVSIRQQMTDRTMA